MPARGCAVALVLLSGVTGSAPPDNGLVPVRFSEGAVHGFLQLASDAEQPLGYGELVQLPGDSSLSSRMTIRFLDGSRFEETVEYTQHQVFRMLAYRLVQQGPAFGTQLDATLSATGRFQVVSAGKPGARPDTSKGRLDLPPDTYNGLPVILVKNLRAGDTTDVHLVAFTPKPRLIGLRIAYDRADSLPFGGTTLGLRRFTLSPRLGALTGFFAKLLGKLPADSHAWIISEEVPAFLRFRGPMYLGPVWQLTQTMPGPAPGTKP